MAALEAHGIGTIIDLRNDDELAPDLSPRPTWIETLHLPLDGIEDTDFWDEWTSGPQFGTPLYYAAFLERFPERAAGAPAAVADAQPGGVLLHCVGGRDRTGLISALALALARVDAEEVAADYALGAMGAGRLGERKGEPQEIDAFLRARSTSARELVVELVASLDIESLLRAGGLSDAQLAALRARLLGSPRRSNT